MVGDETLRSYWSRGIHIQTRLNDINMTTPDTTLQIWLLRGLPPAYDHYKDIATNHAGANVDIYAMLAFLQVHEVKHHVKQAQSSAGGVLRAFPRKCYSCGSEHHTAAMCPARLAAHPGKVSVFQRIGSSLTCSHCGKPGHSSDACFSLHPHLRPRFPFPGPPPLGTTCTNCHRLGHTADKCYHTIGFPSASTSNRERSRSPSRSGARVNTTELTVRHRDTTPSMQRI